MLPHKSPESILDASKDPVFFKERLTAVAAACVVEISQATRENYDFCYGDIAHKIPTDTPLHGVFWEGIASAGLIGLNFDNINRNFGQLVMSESTPATKLIAGKLFAEGGIYISEADRTVYYGHSSKPIELVNIINEDGSSIKPDTVETEYTKKKSREFASKVGVDAPRIYGGYELNVDRINDFVASHANGVVVKPNDGSIGRNVRIYPGPVNPEHVINYMATLYQCGEEPVLEHRIVAPAFTDYENNLQNMQWNVRALAFNGLVDMYARCGYEDEPINASLGAHKYPISEVLARVEADHGLPMATVRKSLDEATRRLSCALPDSLIGLDLVVDQNGKVFLLEINGMRSGGMSSFYKIDPPNGKRALIELQNKLFTAKTPTKFTADGDITAKNPMKLAKAIRTCPSLELRDTYTTLAVDALKKILQRADLARDEAIEASQELYYGALHTGDEQALFESVRLQSALLPLGRLAQSSHALLVLELLGSYPLVKPSDIHEYFKDSSKKGLFDRIKKSIFTNDMEKLFSCFDEYAKEYSDNRSVEDAAHHLLCCLGHITDDAHQDKALTHNSLLNIAKELVAPNADQSFESIVESHSLHQTMFVGDSYGLLLLLLALRKDTSMLPKAMVMAGCGEAGLTISHDILNLFGNSIRQHSDFWLQDEFTFETAFTMLMQQDDYSEALVLMSRIPRDSEYFTAFTDLYIAMFTRLGLPPHRPSNILQDYCKKYIVGEVTYTDNAFQYDKKLSKRELLVIEMLRTVIAQSKSDYAFVLSQRSLKSIIPIYSGFYNYYDLALDVAGQYIQVD